MGRSRPRRPKLPPLIVHQFQLDQVVNQIDGDYWWTWGHAVSIGAARRMARGTLNAAVIRRLRDGKIVYRNKAARAAGI